MKKNTLSFLVVPILIITLGSCTTSKSEKVDDAAKEVQDAKKELDEANKQYAKEVASYRSSMEMDLRSNKVLIAKLKDEKSDAKKEAVVARNAKIDALQKRNEELETRMSTYKSDDKENWKSFKREFNNDMSELGKAFKDLGKDNVN